MTFPSKTLGTRDNPKKYVNYPLPNKHVSVETAMPSLKTDSQTLYQTDYLQWIETTAKKLRSQDYGTVDWENLIEEIEDMGRSERRSLESNLIVVLLHLLKWQYQPERRSGSWESSIIEHRRRIKKAIQESPSLKPYLDSILTESYTEAVKQAKAETGLPLETFSTECPYEAIAVINDEFLPQ
jgi:Domain of unknown function DUF29